MMLLLWGVWGPLAGRRHQTREAKAAVALASRSIFVSPAEVYSLMHGGRVPLALIDLRQESAFNEFHLRDARRVELRDVEGLLSLPRQTVKILMSSGEQDAAEAWRRLALRGALGFYVLEGGVEAWLTAFSEGTEQVGGEEASGCPALGERSPVSAPDLETPPTFQAKVKRPGGAKKGGGCGG